MLKEHSHIPTHQVSGMGPDHEQHWEESYATYYTGQEPLSGWRLDTARSWVWCRYPQWSALFCRDYEKMVGFEFDNFISLFDQWIKTGNQGIFYYNKHDVWCQARIYRRYRFLNPQFVGLGGESFLGFQEALAGHVST